MAIGGSTSSDPILAAKEFLRGGGSSEALRGFLFGSMRDQGELVGGLGEA